MLSGTVRRAFGVLAAAMLAACGGATSEQLIGPTGSRCQITVAPPPTFPAAGSNVSVEVSAARDCTWTAASDAAWATVSPASGQGSSTVAVTVAQNARPTTRSAALTVNDSHVAISQEAAPCRFELGSQRARLDGAGGQASVIVSTIDGCRWQASTSADWLRVLTPGGEGSGAVHVNVSRNGGPERATTISIAGLSFAVSQDSGVHEVPPGAPGPPASPSSGCAFTIDADRARVQAAGGQGSVRVMTAGGCEWSASTNAPWISLQRSSGTGPDIVAYQVTAHFSTVSERSGSISVAGHTLRVTQAACGLAIEPGVPGFLPAGGDSSFAVTTEPGCTWSASAGVDWITITSGGGAGTGSITYRVAPNPIERDRSGTIVVSGRSKTIVQQALGQGG